MKLENVTKIYGATQALKNVSMEIEEGKITAVLGESGAGKTTLLNVLAGLTSYEGTVDGNPFQGRRGDCSYLFQDAKLLPNLSVEGNLKFVLKKEQWGEIEDMLEKVKLWDKKDARPRELSGGERQRVAIARAFLYPHKLLLMDEPFSSLDLHLKKSLIELVCTLWKEQESTVVCVTHDVREAALLCSRAVIMERGEVKDEITIGDAYPRDFLHPPKEMDEIVEKLLWREIKN